MLKCRCLCLFLFCVLIGFVGEKPLIAGVVGIRMKVPGAIHYADRYARLTRLFLAAQGYYVDAVKGEVMIRWNSSASFSVADWENWKKAVRARGIPVSKQTLLINTVMIYTQTQVANFVARPYIKLQMAGPRGGIYVVGLAPHPSAKALMFYNHPPAYGSSVYLEGYVEDQLNQKDPSKWPSVFRLVNLSPPRIPSPPPRTRGGNSLFQKARSNR